MTQYTLIYFNARGRAELIRWICTYADIPFTDERIEKEDWPARKATIPGGKVPVMMVGDKPLTQSLAIARYMAKVGGLVPDDDFEAAIVDAIGDTFNDMMTDVYKVLWASGDKEQQEKQYKEEVYPNVIVPVLKMLEERLKDKEFFSSNKVTWADLLIGLCFCGMEIKQKDLMNGYPVVKAHVDKICNLPKIKAWNENQPETQF